MHYAEPTGQVLEGTPDDLATHYRLTVPHQGHRYVIAAYFDLWHFTGWAFFPTDAMGYLTAWYQLGAEAPTLAALLALHGYQER